MPAVEPRYAEGLLSAAKNPEQAAEIGKALEDFCALTEESSVELKEFLLNPSVPAEAKKATVQKILTDSAPVYARNFLFLLIDKGRIANLRGILDDYQDKRMQLGGVLKVVVTSDRPLDEKQVDEISEKYRKKYGAEKVYTQTRIDKTLMGGVRVQIGDILTDNSLAGRLRGIKSAIDRIKQ